MTNTSKMTQAFLQNLPIFYSQRKNSEQELHRKDKLDNNDDILTVWFDSWKYEKEKYLAIVPLIRTIEIELEDKMLKSRAEKEDPS